MAQSIRSMKRIVSIAGSRFATQSMSRTNWHFCCRTSTSGLLKRQRFNPCGTRAMKFISEEQRKEARDAKNNRA
jgi:hypothetical protein